jgi:signal peptidase II
VSRRAAWARAGLVAAAVLLADQLSKQLAIRAVARGERAEVLLGIELVNVRNTGVAFGQLQGATTIVAIVVVLAVIGLLVYFARNAGRPWVWLPTGLLLGGAAGNAIDRILEGAVIDFLKVPLWPAFNVADAAITVGVVALFVAVELGARREERERDGAPRPA